MVGWCLFLHCFFCRLLFAILPASLVWLARLVDDCRLPEVDKSRASLRYDGTILMAGGAIISRPPPVSIDPYVWQDRPYLSLKAPWDSSSLSVTGHPRFTISSQPLPHLRHVGRTVGRGTVCEPLSGGTKRATVGVDWAPR